MHICSSIAPAIINSYRSDCYIFIGGEVMHFSDGTTQRDPLAMAMYAIATLPLICHLKEASSANQVWFADDATTGDPIQHLKQSWEVLEKIDTDFGYYVNASKSWLIVKEEHQTDAIDIFANNGVRITKEGKRHLGAALGRETFFEEFVTAKIQEWVQEVDQLSNIVSMQPHTAYAATTHGLTNKWSILQKTIPNIRDLFQPLQNAIRHHLLPALTGRKEITDLERDLLTLPTRLSGLWIPNPTRVSNIQHRIFQNILAPLTALILLQDMSYSVSVANEQHGSNGRSVTKEDEFRWRRLPLWEKIDKRSAACHGLGQRVRCIPLGCSSTTIRTWVHQLINNNKHSYQNNQQHGSLVESREPSKMLSICATDGTSPIYPPTVSVGKGSSSRMLLAAQLVGSQHSDISSGISLQTCLAMCATASL